MVDVRKFLNVKQYCVASELVDAEKRLSEMKAAREKQRVRQNTRKLFIPLCEMRQGSQKSAKGVNAERALIASDNVLFRVHLQVAP